MYMGYAIYTFSEEREQPMRSDTETPTVIPIGNDTATVVVVYTAHSGLSRRNN